MHAQKKVVCLDGQTAQINQASSAENIDNLLEQYGFEIVHTSQQEQGINTVCRETPDVILLDMSENQSSVWDLYYQIRKSTRTCNIPVILITPKVTRIEDVIKLYAANAADYLIKPFASHELMASINQALLN